MDNKYRSTIVKHPVHSLAPLPYMVMSQKFLREIYGIFLESHKNLWPLIYKEGKVNIHFTPDLFNIKFPNVKYLNSLSVGRVTLRSCTLSSIVCSLLRITFKISSLREHDICIKDAQTKTVISLNILLFWSVAKDWHWNYIVCLLSPGCCVSWTCQLLIPMTRFDSS